jgi:hypothetical protein
MTNFHQASYQICARVSTSVLFWHLRIRPARPPSFEPAPIYQSVSQKEEK